MCLPFIRTSGYFYKSYRIVLAPEEATVIVHSSHAWLQDTWPWTLPLLVGAGRFLLFPRIIYILITEKHALEAKFVVTHMGHKVTALTEYLMT